MSEETTEETPAETGQPAAPQLSVGDMVVGRTKNTNGLMAGVVQYVYSDGRVLVDMAIREFGNGYGRESGSDEAYADQLTLVKLADLV